MPDVVGITALDGQPWGAVALGSSSPSTRCAWSTQAATCCSSCPASGRSWSSTGASESLLGPMTRPLIEKVGW